MARYHILKDFKGSQDGRFTEDFKAGTEADLSDYLVSCLPADSIQRIADGSTAPVSAPEPAGASKKRKPAVPPAPTDQPKE